MKTNKGFTLIEIMISVLIIGVLAGVTLSMLNSGGFRQKGRDAQRVADLKKIQAALELFYSDNRRYPIDNASWVIPGTNGNISSAVLGTGIKTNYINTIPVDPSASGSPANGCTLGSGNTNYQYMYKTDANGYSYMLFARMELDASAAPSRCSSLNGIYTATYCTNAGSLTAVNCYGVQNP